MQLHNIQFTKRFESQIQKNAGNQQMICTGTVVLWLPSHHPSGCCTLVVVEERPPHMIVKRFGCTTIHNKALYKCFIHSFIQMLKILALCITVQQITNNNDKTTTTKVLMKSANSKKQSYNSICIIYSCCSACWELTKP